MESSASDSSFGSQDATNRLLRRQNPGLSVEEHPIHMMITIREYVQVWALTLLCGRKTRTSSRVRPVVMLFASVAAFPMPSQEMLIQNHQ